MLRTNSIAFPNMFDVSRGCVQVVSDNASIVNRSRLLILTEPTELYNEPNFGVGLKRHLWKYNTPNEQAIIKDRIVDQLRLHEPCVDADKTSFADGLLFSGSEDRKVSSDNYNQLKITVGLHTVYGNQVVVDGISEE